MEIVAELSCNHLGRFANALRLIRAAKAAGADAVKLQCWHPDHMVVDRSYVIEDGAWAGRNLYDLYQHAWTPWEWFPGMFDYAKELGIDCFASVFDTEALQFLENIGCPRYKIASFEALDRALIRAVDDTDKPVILSTGLMTLDDIRELYDSADLLSKVTLLKCVSEYPAKASSYNLRAIDQLRDFADDVGVSDHTSGLVVPIAAATLGADMLEKHFTLSRADGGLDAAFSVEPDELRELVEACRSVDAALKEDGYVNPSNIASKLGRSLYWAKDIKAGEEITEAHLMTARPALGLSPRHFDELVGEKAWDDAAKGQPVTFPRND